MHCDRTTCLALVGALMCASSLASARKPIVDKYRYTSMSAHGEAFTSDACGDQGVAVDAYSDVARIGGSDPRPGTFVLFSILREYCDGSRIDSVVGFEDEPLAITFDGTRVAATFAVPRVDRHDNTLEMVDVSLEFRWIGTGKHAPQTTHNFEHGASLNLHSRENGYREQARVVQRLVVDGEEIELPHAFGYIIDARNGSLSIPRP